MPKVEVVRTYLELTEPGALRSVPSPDSRARVERVEGCPASFFRYLYAEVGRSYHWVDRLGWTRRRVARPTREPGGVALPADAWQPLRPATSSWSSTRTAPWRSPTSDCCRSSSAAASASTCSARRPRRRGRSGPTRVWLHTCTLDDPAALPNYLARGFRAFKSETYEAEREPRPRCLSRLNVHEAVTERPSSVCKS